MKRIVLCLVLLANICGQALAVPPTKPYADLQTGDILTATWLMGTFNTLYSWCQNHGIASGATHGILGNFVGTTDTQALDNKTLNGPVIKSASISETVVCSGTVVVSGSISRSGTTVGGTFSGVTLSNTTTNSGTISGGTMSPATLSPTSITGGNIAGNISVNSGVTIDGVDISAHAYDTTTAHGCSGGVVGANNTQTLTNKTLTSPTLNNPTINGGSGVLVAPQTTSPAQTAEGSVVWDSDDDLLTIGTGAGRKTLVNTDSTQTLTNKTISGGTISGVTISGGTISGVTISGGTISGGTISGGTISGTVTNSGTISGGIVSGTNMRVPTAQPSSLANGDIWVE